MDYRQAGVNISVGNALVKKLKKKNPAIGGFGGIFPMLDTQYNLVSSTDGVGTKLKLAFMLNKHNSIGQDLVGMNVNDLVCVGAKPLFFLDYFACSKLDLKQSEIIINGISKACKLADCILIGGETAEMPDFYKAGEYDLAGFAVGYVRKGKEISGKNIKAGDIVLGLSSSGPHSNGYSLIRKVLTPAQMKKYSKALICPTKIYVKPVIGAIKKFNKNTQNITGIAHITGGSFYDKIGRILPKGLGVRIDKNSWAVPEIFNIIKHAAKIDEMEMYKTLNMGIGMVLIVRKTMAENIKKFFKDAKIIGHVAKSKNSVEIV